MGKKALAMSMGFGATESISNFHSDKDHLGDQEVTSFGVWVMEMK